MRITSQMMTTVEKKAGIDTRRKSILDYMNERNRNALLGKLKGSSTASDSVTKTKYEKLENAAEDLLTQAEGFIDESEEGLFAKAAQSDDNTKLCEAAKNLADLYNNLLTSMKGCTSSALQQFYYQNLKSAASDSVEPLSKIGMAVGTDGKLTVDDDKLSECTADELKQVFGVDSEFMAKLVFVSVKIGSNAASYVESSRSTYTQTGNSGTTYGSNYDARG